MDRYEEALNAYDTARQFDPLDPDILRMKRQAFVQMGLFAIAGLFELQKELHVDLRDPETPGFQSEVLAQIERLIASHLKEPHHE